MLADENVPPPLKPGSYLGYISICYVYIYKQMHFVIKKNAQCLEIKGLVVCIAKRKERMTIILSFPKNILNQVIIKCITKKGGEIGL